MRVKTTIRTLLLATITAVLAACSGTKKPQPATLTPFTASLTVSVAWKTEVGRTVKFESGIGQFSPAVSGESVYAASQSGTVSRVSLADGKVLWRAQAGAPIVAGVAVGSGASSGMTAVITDKSELVIFADDGKVFRRIALGGVAQEIPLLSASTAVVRLADNRLAGWDIQSGNRRWVLQRNLPPLVLQAQSGLRGAVQPPEESGSPVVGPSDVLVNMPGGRLMWIDAVTGAVRWESQVVTPRGTNEVERIVDLLGAPTVQGPDVCVSAYQTSVACLGAESGRRVWSREITASTTLGADERYVFVADEQSRLHALNRRDGQTVWSIETLRLRQLSGPLSFGRAVWVADRFGYLHALAREDGKVLNRLSLDGGAVSGAIRPTSKGLVIQTQGGQLLLIRSEG